MQNLTSFKTYTTCLTKYDQSTEEKTVLERNTKFLILGGKDKGVKQPLEIQGRVNKLSAGRLG